jgi:hypothetical protein
VASPEYDLPLKGGHVIDAKNNIDRLMDVAIRDGKIAKVARTLPAHRAVKTVNVTGKFVYDLNAMSGNPWNHPPTLADKDAKPLYAAGEFVGDDAAGHGELGRPAVAESGGTGEVSCD